MSVAATGAPHDTGADEPDELMSLLASWKRTLRAQRISPATIGTYAIHIDAWTDAEPSAPIAHAEWHDVAELIARFEGDQRTPR